MSKTSTKGQVASKKNAVKQEPNSSAPIRRKITARNAAEQMPNLSFLWKLVLESPLSKQEVCDRLGMTPQNLNSIFKRDDMKLSLVSRILDILGYDFFVSYEMDGIVTEPLILDFETTLKCIDAKNLKVARLSFLAIAMKVFNLTSAKVAEALEVNPGQVGRIFASDDIFMSYLYKIARKYDLRLKFQLKKRESKRVDMPANTSIEIL